MAAGEGDQGAMLSVTKRLLPLAKLVVVLIAPFAVAVVSWEIAERFAPGRFATADWHVLTAVTFLLAGLVTTAMLFRTSIKGLKKIALSVLCVVVYLYFAFIASLQSHCGDEPSRIGQRSQGPSCQEG